MFSYTELYNQSKAQCCNNGDVTPKMPVQSCITLAQSSRKAYCYTELQGRQVLAQSIVFCTEHCFCAQSFVFFEEGITDVTQSSAYKRAVYKISVHRALLIYTELHNPGKALCCNYASFPLQTPVQSGISGAQSSG